MLGAERRARTRASICGRSRDRGADRASRRSRTLDSRSTRRPHVWSRSARAPTSRRCAATSTGCCSTPPDKPKITLEDVQEVVSGETAQDDWAVTNAIARGDTAEALRQLGLALEAGGVSYQILGQLAWFVRERLAAADPRRVRRPSKRCSARIWS